MIKKTISIIIDLNNDYTIINREKNNDTIKNNIINNNINTKIQIASSKLYPKNLEKETQNYNNNIDINNTKTIILPSEKESNQNNKEENKNIIKNFEDNLKPINLNTFNFKTYKKYIKSYNCIQKYKTFNLFSIHPLIIIT